MIEHKYVCVFVQPNDFGNCNNNSWYISYLFPPFGWTLVKLQYLKRTWAKLHDYNDRPKNVVIAYSHCNYGCCTLSSCQALAI